MSQNSENFSFDFIRSKIDANPNLPGVQQYNFTEGVFDIELTASHTEQVPQPWLPDFLIGRGWYPPVAPKEVVDIDVRAQVHVVPTSDFHLVA